MIVYMKSKTGAFGINLSSVADFDYDHKTRKLSIRYSDGRLYTSMDERFIKAFFDALSRLEQHGEAHCAIVERGQVGE
ncbi:MAG: hypothetical protein QXI19_06730 [Candidatus Caldarchaeum sp.]